MASRKLVRDIFLSKRFFHRQLLISQQVSNSSSTSRLLLPNRVIVSLVSLLINEFSKQVKGEVNRNHEFQQSVKQTTEQLYKQADGVWTEAEAEAKKVSSNLKKKILAATDEVISYVILVKDTFRLVKEESSESTATSAKDGTNGKSGSKAASGEETQQQSTSDTENTLFGKFKSSDSYVSPKLALAFQKLKEARPLDLAKKGYGHHKR